MRQEIGGPQYEHLESLPRGQILLKRREDKHAQKGDVVVQSLSRV